MLRAEEMVQIDAPRMIEGSTTLPDNAERTAVTHVGNVNACDLWFRVPTAWESQVTLRVYARVKDARVLIKTVRVNEAQRTTAAGFVSGLGMSLRGLPVTGLEVTAQAPDVVTGTGTFSLSVWSSEAAPALVGGVPTSAAEASNAQTVAHLALRSGTTPVFGAGDALGRAVVKAARDGVMYSVVSPSTVKPSVAAVGTHWLMTLRSAAKRVEVQRIIVSYHGLSAAAAADGRLIVCRSTTAPTNGNSVAVTPRPFDSADTGATATCRAYGTTLSVGGTLLELLSVSLRCDMKDQFIYDADAFGKPLVLLSSGETLAVRFIVDTTVAAQTFGLHVAITFIEV